MRYQVEEIERNAEGIEFRLVFPAASGFFVGHFPDNPILPGVAQVQVCSEVLSASLQRGLFVQKIDSIRYRKPVLPDVPCSLHVTLPDEEGQVNFRWHGPEGAIAEGRLTMGSTDA